MKVYITKHALTKGIEEKEVETNNHSEKMVTTIDRYRNHYHKPYWHEDKEEAIAHAEKIRLSKIETLKKQIIKLEKLNFNKREKF